MFAGRVVPAAQGPFPKLNPEFVVRANPDLIVFTDSAEQGAGLYPGWQHMPAVRQQRMCRFSQREVDLLVRPSPRMAEGAQVLARCITNKLGSHAASPARANPRSSAQSVHSVPSLSPVR